MFVFQGDSLVALNCSVVSCEKRGRRCNVQEIRLLRMVFWVNWPCRSLVACLSDMGVGLSEMNADLRLP